MIYFDKITENQSDIFLIHNSQKIGTLDLIGNTWYIIEVNYVPHEIHVKYKRFVKGMIISAYKSDALKKEKTKRRMERLKEHPYNSYKIIE